MRKKNIKEVAQNYSLVPQGQDAENRTPDEQAADIARDFNEEEGDNVNANALVKGKQNLEEGDKVISVKQLREMALLTKYDGVAITSVDSILKEVHSLYKPIDKRRLSMNFTPFGVVGFFINEDACGSEDPIIVELGDNVDDLYAKIEKFRNGESIPICQGIFALTEDGQELVLRGGGYPIYRIENPRKNPQSRVELWNFLEKNEKNGSLHYARRVY